LKQRARQHFQRLHDESHGWLDRHPRTARMLDVTGCLGTATHQVARGAAAGLFVALIPVFGMQTLLLLLVCVLARANFPVAFLVSWVSNPFTIGGIALAANFAGRAVFGTLALPFTDAGSVADIAVEQTLLTLLGSLVVATPVAMLGYAIALWLQRAMHHEER
jgi:uncharacterized protein (DUF2062 family)